MNHTHHDLSHVAERLQERAFLVQQEQDAVKELQQELVAAQASYDHRVSEHRKERCRWLELQQRVAVAELQYQQAVLSLEQKEAPSSVLQRPTTLDWPEDLVVEHTTQQLLYQRHLQGQIHSVQRVSARRQSQKEVLQSKIAAVQQQLAHRHEQRRHRKANDRKARYLAQQVRQALQWRTQLRQKLQSL